MEFKKINGITEVSTAPSPPSKEHWFGTDRYGRDLLTLYLYGLKYGLCSRVRCISSVAPRCQSRLLGGFVGASSACFSSGAGGIGQYSGDYRFVFPLIPIGDQHSRSHDLLDLASGRHPGGDGGRPGRFRHTAENRGIEREVVI